MGNDIALVEHCQKLVYRKDGKMRPKYARAIDSLPARAASLLAVYADLCVIGIAKATPTALGWLITKID